MTEWQAAVVVAFLKVYTFVHFYIATTRVSARARRKGSVVAELALLQLRILAAAPIGVPREDAVLVRRVLARRRDHNRHDGIEIRLHVHQRERWEGKRSALVEPGRTFPTAASIWSTMAILSGVQNSWQDCLQYTGFESQRTLRCAPHTAPASSPTARAMANIFSTVSMYPPGDLSLLRIL